MQYAIFRNCWRKAAKRYLRAQEVCIILVQCVGEGKSVKTSRIRGLCSQTSLDMEVNYTISDLMSHLAMRNYSVLNALPLPSGSRKFWIYILSSSIGLDDELMPYYYTLFEHFSEHVHGIVYFKKAVRLTGIQKVFRGEWWAIRPTDTLFFIRCKFIQQWTDRFNIPENTMFWDGNLSFPRMIRSESSSSSTSSSGVSLAQDCRSCKLAEQFKRDDELKEVHRSPVLVKRGTHMSVKKYRRRRYRVLLVNKKNQRITINARIN